VTTTNALEKAIRAMAEELADGVIKLISTMPLQNLAALTGDRSLLRSARGRELLELEAGGSRKKDGASAGKGSGRAAKSERSAARGAKSSKGEKKPRKLIRRSPEEMNSLREGILAALRGTKDWMSSKDISNTLKSKPTARDLLFPIGYLRERGMIQKKGSRGDSLYKITERGMSDL
jgi:hypothetical protein